MAVEIISKMKPKNNGSFAVADAADIELADGRRAQEALDNMEPLQEGIFSGDGESNNGMFNTAIIKKTDDLGVEYHEYWFFVNARYDAAEKRFKRLDKRLNSFGIQYQAKGTYPGEAALGDTVNQGIGYWRAIGTNYFHKIGDTQSENQVTDYIGVEINGTWHEFGILLGWNNCYMLDSYGGMTIGGAGFELDGNGLFPYARLTLSKFAGGSSTGKELTEYGFAGAGICWNAYHQFSNSDDVAANSYFFGLKAPINYYKDLGTYNPFSNFADMSRASVAFMRRTGGTAHHTEDWETLFEIAADGQVTAKGLTTSNTMPLHGKELTILGDSFSDGETGDPALGGVIKKYWKHLVEKDGMIVTCHARGGSGYMQGHTDAYDLPFYKQAELVTADTEHVLILGSVNDYMIDVGSITDDIATQTTLCAGINATMDKLIEINPKITIMVVTPTPTTAYNCQLGNADAHIDALISICKKRGIPYLDLYRQSNLRPWITAINNTLYIGDNVHPNAIGQEKYIYPQVKAFIQSIIL